MNYTFLKEKPEKNLLIKDFSRGIKSSGAYDGPSFDFLSESNNMIFKNGRLETRNGIKIKQTIANDTFYPYRIKNLSYTGTEFYFSGKGYSAAYCVDTDKVSGDMIRVFLIDREFNITEPSAVMLNRLDSTYFSRFDNVIFFSSKPITGSGFFAFIRTKEENSGTLGYRIYELKSDLSGFTECYSESVYIPVVFMNGRGNKFNLITDENFKSLPDPAKPEPLNLLNSAFYAYYTSDSSSSSFKLPFMNLDSDKGIICKVYTEPGVYSKFTILGSAEESDAVSLYSYNAKLHLDRSNGVFKFTVDGSPLSVPASSSYGINTIEVLAHKTTEGGKEKIFSCSGCTEYNSRFYFYGSSVSPDEIFSTRNTSKLYFPKTGTVVLGKSGAKITAMGTVCNKLVAFKENEIYRISQGNTKTYTSGDIVGVSTDFTNTEQLKAEPVHNSVGCDCPKTVVPCSNRLIWLNSDGKVYNLATTTYGKENNIFEISEFISDFLKNETKENMKSASAISFEGYYMLIIGSSIYILNYKTKDFGYPKKYSGAVSDDGTLSWFLYKSALNGTAAECIRIGSVPAVCCSTDSDLSYISIFEGNNDETAFRENNEDKTEFKKISCGFKTQNIDFSLPLQKKKLSEIILDISASSDVTLKAVFDGVEKCYIIRPDKNGSMIRLRPFSFPFYKLKIGFSSDNNFSFGSIMFKYSI